jgi:hypothetical protein
MPRGKDEEFMSTTTLPAVQPKTEAIERVVIQGDLSKLGPEERVNYYRLVCESVGLNPLTKPLEYITLNGKLTLYARKDATDQLRQNHQVSISIAAREFTEGCYVVTARASFPNGRTDESIGAVPIENLKGEARANAMMKCETKAKRRVTLSICGLGMLDELEVDSIPSARPEVARTQEPIKISSPVTVTAAVEAATVGSTPEPLKAANGAPEVDLVPPPVREPGSDDGEECIDLPRQRALHRAFAEAIRDEATRKRAATIFREWLKHNGYTDGEGNGSTKRIPVILFDEVRVTAVKYADSL